jgi:hypothetical protein
LLVAKDGVEQMLEQLDLTDDERAALEGDRHALVALAERLVTVPTPAGPTPEHFGADSAFVALTRLGDSLMEPNRAGLESGLPNVARSRQRTAPANTSTAR